MTALSIEYSKLFEETKKASLRTNPMNKGFSDIKVNRLPETISPSIVGVVVAFSIAPERGR
ncbi:MAG TPA: hypothetical protein VMW14_01990 [Candidatus Paceibacterota bacterium]|nr:hypothetical protein [Candidatus Paceibacterota bacterium]